jgi:hypothetical protein
MNREEQWMKKRLGMITASELGQITSARGGIIDGNVAYIRQKRFERNRGYALPVSSKAMDVGNETEPMIAEWAKANLDVARELVYSKDIPEIPFWIAPDCPLGASPDAFTPDETVEFEFKTLVGNETTEFFCDPYTSYEEKKLRVWKEHGDQMLGQFIAKPSVQTIVLIKYAPQRDDIMADTDSPLAEWRGSVFYFARKDYEASIAEMRKRVILFDAMIDAKMSPSEFKSGQWYVSEDGELKVK